jgi:YVTN family beta-propeller protein
VYITNGANPLFPTGAVSVIDTATNTVTATVRVGNGPLVVAVTPDGSEVYVTNISSNNVSVINTTTNTVTATIPVGGQPGGVAVTPDGSKVYVTNQSSVSVIAIKHVYIQHNLRHSRLKAFIVCCRKGEALYHHDIKIVGECEIGYDRYGEGFGKRLTYGFRPDKLKSSPPDHGPASGRGASNRISLIACLDTHRRLSRHLWGQTTTWCTSTTLQPDGN